MVKRNNKPATVKTSKAVAKRSVAEKTSSAPKGSRDPAPRLYRVWRRTADDESMHEIIVIASSAEQAKDRALEHVKATNAPGKGGRSKADSKKLTEILSVKTVNHRFCLEISKVPVAAIKRIKMSRLK
ncbi:MAG: hypothetical protein HS110_10150 [Zoogloeaceae bacterium]|nr:hypothetical protein [Zoogloeaceae bacterium]MCK6383920.1 hypothetical protein [Rhodocyclaceae bacterium]